MLICSRFLMLTGLTAWFLLSHPVQGADAAKGQRLFQACAACHSIEPGRHLTGPSLAGVVGKKAGTAEGFRRYSDALKSADLVWNEGTLDAWLADPAALVPGNLMTFPGIKDPAARQDLIAYLKTASATASNEGGITGQDGMGGMMGQGSGGMGGPSPEDLEALGPEHQVKAITYCGDTYRVTTVAGQTLPIWEFNLRFKTDSSDKGPPKGRPALLRASMAGDRAFVIFADPSEISSFIKPQC
jgi:cytochrome c